jgi:hypothetical protein
MREERSALDESRTELAEIAPPKAVRRSVAFRLPCGSIAFIRFSSTLYLRRVGAGKNSAGGNYDFSRRNH